MVKSKRSRPVNSSNGSSSSSSGIDIISNLPDHLISHILSLLPIKDAVASSVLSTRWKFLWTFITNLNLEFNCDRNFTYGTLEMKMKLRKFNRRKFNRIVKRVLLLLNPPSVHKFSIGLCCPDCIDLRYLYSWISAGFGRNVGEFTLYFDNQLALQLPIREIGCNFAVLNLSGYITFNIPATVSLCFPCLKAIYLDWVTCVIPCSSSISFPNLKIMSLHCVKFKSEGSFNKLLSSSPLLDDLSIMYATYDDDMEEFIIHIPSLTRLSIYVFPLEDKVLCKLKINAPALQYLYLDGRLACECLIVENLSFSLLSDLTMFFRYGNDVNAESSFVKIIGRFSKVKFLSVRSDFLKAFKIVSTNITSGFHNLTRLEIKLYHCLDLSMLISDFLESMDNLEHLVMQTCMFGGIKCPEQSWWIEPLNVPKCLMLRLSTVSFRDITTGCCDQLELLRYFLKNAKVLQMLTLSTSRSSEKQQNLLLKKILLMPRASHTCEVAFI